MRLVIVGLGYGQQFAAALRQTEGQLFLRTERCAAAGLLKGEAIPFEAMDALYEKCQDFDMWAQAVAERLLSALAEGPVTYAVPGSVLSDSSVQLTIGMARAAGHEVAVTGAPSAEQEALAAASAVMDIDLSGGYTALCASALEGTHVEPSRTLVVTELGDPLLAGQAKLALAHLYGDEQPLVYVRFEKGAWQARTIALYELDRQGDIDHTACAVVPAVPYAARQRHTVSDLADILERLRAPGGCPWDREQTHQTLKRYLLEEAYETLDAVDSGQDDKLMDELGDVLLQVIFHAQVARERGAFDLQDVATSECQKMIVRHPHVFADGSAKTSGEVLDKWDEIKREQRGQQTLADALRGITKGMSALMRAQKVQGKVRKVGFDFTDCAQALGKVSEEAGELLAAVGEGQVFWEAGDLLFAAVNAARLGGVDAEQALSAATERFIARFAAMEQLALPQGGLEGMDMEQMDALWRQAKEQESANL
nr:nucleoside triphosphate pyrophosphohydrolase [bacterium]